MDSGVLTGFFIAFGILLVLIAVRAYSQHVSRRYGLKKYKTFFDALFNEYRDWLKMKNSSTLFYHKSLKTAPTLIKDTSMDKGVKKYMEPQRDELIARLSADLLNLKGQKLKVKDEKCDLCEELTRFLKKKRLKQLVFDSSCVRFNVTQLKEIQQFVSNNSELKIVIPYDAYQELLLLRQSEFYAESATYLTKKFRFEQDINANIDVLSGIKRLYRNTPRHLKIQPEQPTCIVFCNYLRFYEFIEYTDSSKNVFAICLDREFVGLPDEVYHIESVMRLKQKCANSIDLRSVNSVVKKEVSKPSVEYDMLYIGEGHNKVKKSELEPSGLFGGEGLIYEHPHNKSIFIKLYNKYGLPCDEKVEKLQLLIEKGKQLNRRQVYYAFPLELVYSDVNCTCCVGFTMPKIENKKNLFDYVSFHENEYFWQTVMEESLPLAKNILLRFLELEVSGVYYIDCALENVLYDPDTHEVYFVDMDSAQVNNHLSAVYREYFLHPDMPDTSEDLKIYCSHHLREPNQVQFSLCLLVLQVLLCINNFLMLNNERIPKNHTFTDLTVKDNKNRKTALETRWFCILSNEKVRETILNELLAKVACTTGDFLFAYDDMRKIIE